MTSYAETCLSEALKLRQNIAFWNEMAKLYPHRRAYYKSEAKRSLSRARYYFSEVRLERWRERRDAPALEAA